MNPYAPPPTHREPPHNLEAEQGLLGAILVNNRAYERVAGFLLPDHFADPVNGRIFLEAGRLIDRGALATPITLKGIFDQEDALREVGGAGYLFRLAGSVVTVINSEDYGREILECYMRRCLIEAGEELMNACFARDGERDFQAIMSEHQGMLDFLAETKRDAVGLVPLADAVTAAVKDTQAAMRGDKSVLGLSTGITDLDETLAGGMFPGDLLILGARPAMGKTALAIQIAFNVASPPQNGRDPKPVAFFSLEMAKVQLARRLIAERTGIPTKDQRMGRVTSEQLVSIANVGADLARIPLHIDDQPASSVAEIRRRAQDLKRRLGGLGLIIVDYLQLVAPGNTRKAREQNRTQDVSEIARGLKNLAKALGVPVLALAQLGRAVEQREDKRPVMADIRESGEIEAAADTIMLLYRHHYYLTKAEPVRREKEKPEDFLARQGEWLRDTRACRNDMDVIFGKVREGDTGTVRVHYEPERNRITNRASTEALPYQNDF